MPASQHQKPKSDIEIAQAAKPQPIMQLAKDRLGIAPENLEPYGHYKAKVSMDYIKSLQSKPNGKLILVSAITPTPAGEGKTTTTVGLTDALNHIGKKARLRKYARPRTPANARGARESALRRPAPCPARAAPRRRQISADLACATSSANASGSRTARSASTLRFTSTPARRRPSMKRE